LLSSNPNAIALLEQNLDKINWYELSQNPNAMGILEKNLDKINWIYLSGNPNAMELLEANHDKIDCYERSPVRLWYMRRVDDKSISSIKYAQICRLGL